MSYDQCTGRLVMTHDQLIQKKNLMFVTSSFMTSFLFKELLLK